MRQHACAILALSASLSTAAVAQDATHKSRAAALLEAKDYAGALAAAAAAVEAAPDDLDAHELWLRAARQGGARSADQRAELAQRVEERYRAWSERFPDSAGVAYGIGSFLHSQEDPRARPHLERVVAREPNNAKVWQMLSIDAERWGDRAASREHLHKATLADPANPDYAFYHASSFHGADDVRWVEASLDVVKRFPDSERAAQALYWLGVRSRGDAAKIPYWERSRREFAPEKHRWSASSMGELFEAYLRTDPNEAVQLAAEMAERLPGERGGDGWPDRKAMAERLIAVQQHVAAGRFADAKPLAEGLKAGRFSANAGWFARLQAEVLAGAGDVAAAFDLLARRCAVAPEDATRTALFAYARHLGRSEQQARDAVWAIRDAASKPAPDFELGRYDSDAKVALRDLRGKVVLLTFWFPGCGPCRGEFPHFENVLRRFAGREDVAYLAINGIPLQDAYVLPFVKATGYSFLPLRGNEEFCKETYKVRGYPTNFLIDRDGRIVYQGFRTTGDNEQELERMIQSLLDRPAAAASRPASR
jgi:thiol-disulfide isomerase/thioredoxin